jgi:hypothetical protein
MNHKFVDLAKQWPSYILVVFKSNTSNLIYTTYVHKITEKMLYIVPMFIKDFLRYI